VNELRLLPALLIIEQKTIIRLKVSDQSVYLLIARFLEPTLTFLGAYRPEGVEKSENRFIVRNNSTKQEYTLSLGGLF
jgi:hypothetical protein